MLKQQQFDRRDNKIEKVMTFLIKLDGIRIYKKQKREKHKHLPGHCQPMSQSEKRTEFVWEAKGKSASFILLQLHLTCHRSHLLPLTHNHILFFSLTHTSIHLIFPDFHSHSIHSQTFSHANSIDVAELCNFGHVLSLTTKLRYQREINK